MQKDIGIEDLKEDAGNAKIKLLLFQISKSSFDPIRH